MPHFTLTVTPSGNLKKPEAVQSSNHREKAHVDKGEEEQGTNVQIHEAFLLCNNKKFPV